MSDETLADYKALLIENFPELAESRLSLLTIGFHSIAVDVDDRLIFKFPRHDEVATALRAKASLLYLIRPPGSPADTGTHPFGHRYCSHGTPS